MTYIDTMYQLTGKKRGHFTISCIVCIGYDKAINKGRQSDVSHWGMAFLRSI